MPENEPTINPEMDESPSPSEVLREEATEGMTVDEIKEAEETVKEMRGRRGQTPDEI